LAAPAEAEPLATNLKPASPAVPAAAEQQQHNDDDQKCRGVHIFPLCKKPRTGSALSEALSFYNIPGAGSSRGVEAPVPTECITSASTIGSIRAKLALLDMSLWTLLGPFRGSQAPESLPSMAAVRHQFRPLWVKSGRIASCRVRPLWWGKRTWPGEESLQTKLQTNHTT
jgi:hypothetical protein